MLNCFFLYIQISKVLRDPANFGQEKGNVTPG